MTLRAIFVAQWGFVSPQTYGHSPWPVRDVSDVCPLKAPIAYLVQQDVVSAAEGATTLLEDFTDCVNLESPG